MNFTPKKQDLKNKLLEFQDSFAKINRGFPQPNVDFESDVAVKLNMMAMKYYPVLTIQLDNVEIGSMASCFLDNYGYKFKSLISYNGQFIYTFRLKI
jgi:hypothetical protein